MSALQFDCRHKYPTGFELCVRFQTQGPITAIVGPSGSGKSTILSAICGILHPEEGTIAFNSKTLLDTRAGIFVPPEKRKIGMVFQEPLLFPHLSVEGNLRFGQKRRQQAVVDFDELIQILEIGDLLKRHPGTLSGGQRQRVAIGRALLSDPELVLLDEPLTGIENDLKSQILSFLKKALGRWKIPAILVTHNLQDVRQIAQDVIQIDLNASMKATHAA